MTREHRVEDSREARRLLERMAGRRVAVIGDAMVDTYLHGEMRRISPEAPVPVLHVSEERRNLGGAANVACCLRALQAEVHFAAVIGSDPTGAQFLEEAARHGIDTSAVVRDARRPTTRKTRGVARNQQVIRFDHESDQPLENVVTRELVRHIGQLTTWADAVVLSDYGKGVLNEDVCRAAMDGARRRGIPVVVDPKRMPWDKFRGATVIKPNRLEAELFTGSVLHGDDDAEAAARALAERMGSPWALITRGADGMTLIRSESREEVYHFRATRRELVDVTGAGDVTAAVIALALAGGASMPWACRLANVAAGIKVGKFGAASVTSDELLAHLGGPGLDLERKILSRDEAARLAARMRAQGRRIVFTNGCFDLLHVGHVSYLEHSRRLGDLLIVGLNSDASVKRLKGPSRPLQSEQDRARILAAQAAVDAVVVFEEDTPWELINAVRPDVLTKSAQYESKHQVVGWDLVESWGGCVVLIEHIEGRSTTRLARRAA